MAWRIDSEGSPQPSMHVRFNENSTHSEQKSEQSRAIPQVGRMSSTPDEIYGTVCWPRPSFVPAYQCSGIWLDGCSLHLFADRQLFPDPQ